MANVNQFAYIEKTLPGIVDKVFAKESLTDSLIGSGDVKVNFLDARTVKVFKLATTGLTDYARGGHGAANTQGAAGSSTETFTLSQERYSAIPLDKLDTMDDAETVLGHLSTEFARTKAVPEFDTYRFSKLASYCSPTIGNMKVGDIDENTIIKEFNAAFKWLSEQKVPNSDQVIFVSPTVMEKIRNTSELAKRLLPSDMSKNVQFKIEEYEGRPIVEVPSDEFFTNAITGDGIYPGANSKVINFLVVSKTAPIIVKKLDFAKVYSSDEGAYLGYVGYVLQNLYYHDLFVPDNKRVGIYCHVSNENAAAYSSALLVDAVAGSTGKTLVRSVLTQPAGKLFDKVGLYTTNGNAPAVGTNYVVATDVLGTEVTPNASHNIFVAVLDSKVVAVSKDFAGDLPKGL